MINVHDSMETIKMIEEEHLDIRTITMGISLRDLASDDVNVLADKIYEKVTRRAEKLVATGEQIERELCPCFSYRSGEKFLRNFSQRQDVSGLCPAHLNLD